MRRRFVALLALAVVAAAQERESGYLGVSVAPLNEEVRAMFGVPDAVAEGVAVLEPRPGSPAAKAGFQPGDVIVRFDGEAVGTPEQLVELVRARPAGTEVSYVVRRGDGTIEGRLTLAKREEPAPPAEPAGPPPLDERLDRLQAASEALHARLLREEKPRTLAGWIAAEERKAETARARGDEGALRRHEIRLDLLREIEAAEVRTTEQRLQRIERKLDEILRRLR